MPQVFIDRAALAALCRRRRIRRLSLFGSTLKGGARSDSDVDLLVEFEPEAKPGLLGHGCSRTRIVAAARGRKADVRTSQDLSRYFREEVERAAEIQYEAGRGHERQYKRDS